MTTELKTILMVFAFCFTGACASFQGVDSAASKATTFDPHTKHAQTTTAWLGDFAAMRVLDEQADLLAREERFSEAAELYELAAARGDKLPSRTALPVILSAATAYARAKQPEDARRMLGVLADREVWWVNAIKSNPAFEAFSDEPWFDDVVARIEKNFALYQQKYADPNTSPVYFDDVARFWQAADLADTERSPSRKAAIFRRHYLAPATPGLIDYHWIKTITTERLVRKIAEASGYYTGIRDRTLGAADYEPEIRKAFRNLQTIYPDAYFPPVTFVIGRLNSGGTAGPEGMLIGLDVWSWEEGIPLDGISEGFQRVLTSFDLNDLPYVVVHEQVHAMQSYAGDRTLLLVSLEEGAADFLAHLVMPDQSRAPYYVWGLKNEARIWKRFQREMLDRDVGDWIGNNGREIDEDWYADIGYFIGARICEAYYEKAEDKQAAIRNLLNVSDAAAILEESGYANRFK